MKSFCSKKTSFNDSSGCFINKYDTIDKFPKFREEKSLKSNYPTKMSAKSDPEVDKQVKNVIESIANVELDAAAKKAEKKARQKAAKKDAMKTEDSTNKPSEKDNNGVENGAEKSGEGGSSKNKKKNKAKAKSSGPKTQTDPPSVPVSELFPGGNFPEGQIMEHPIANDDAKAKDRFGSEEARALDRAQLDMYNEIR